MREKNPPFIRGMTEFPACFERVAGAVMIAASVLFVAPAMASEQTVADNSFSMDAGVHVGKHFTLEGFDPVDLTDLDAVRGAGLSPTGFSDAGSGQQISVILWDELKRNKLGGPDGGSASVTVNTMPSDVTVQITTY